MTEKRIRQGFTLVEMLFVIAIAATVLFVAVRYMKPTIQFIQKFSLRRQMTTEARQSMDTMINLLRSGVPGTIQTQAFGGLTTAPPNSMITFRGRGNRNYQIYWNEPYRIYFVDGTAAPKLLAENVAQLTFSWDNTDPGVVTISLRMEGVIGRERISFDVPNQMVRLGTAP